MTLIQRRAERLMLLRSPPLAVDLGTYDDTMKPITYQNGKFIPASELSIPVHDAGFVWGATVTDRARTFNGRLFRLREHLDRFRGGCWKSRVPLQLSDEELVAVSEKLVEANRGNGEVSVIWIATPGPLDGLAPVVTNTDSGPSLIAYTLPIDPGRTTRIRQSGVKVVSVMTMGVNGPSVKHRSRLSWWVTNEVVREHYGDAQQLFVDFATNNVYETPSSNVIAVLFGELVSPAPGNVLEGISLAVVSELCSQLRLPFVRRDLKREALDQASEILLTNTTDCIAGVSLLDGRPIPFPGPVLLRLLDAWSDLVGVNLREELGGER